MDNGELTKAIQEATRSIQELTTTQATFLEALKRVHDRIDSAIKEGERANNRLDDIQHGAARFAISLLLAGVIGLFTFIFNKG